MIRMTVNVVRREGYLALYNGLSASLCRQVQNNTYSKKKLLTVHAAPFWYNHYVFPLPQMTYSLSRFAIYETIRDEIKNKGLLPFYQKVLLGAFGGMLCYTIWKSFVCLVLLFLLLLCNVFFQQGLQVASLGLQTPDLVNVRWVQQIDSFLICFQAHSSSDHWDWSLKLWEDMYFTKNKSHCCNHSQKFLFQLYVF